MEQRVIETARGRKVRIWVRRSNFKRLGNGIQRYCRVKPDQPQAHDARPRFQCLGSGCRLRHKVSINTRR